MRLADRFQLRHVLCIAPDQPIVFERFSDSAGGYVVLDDSNPAVFKTLIRAAKAKLKLKMRASVPSDAPKTETLPSEPSAAASTVSVPPRDATTLSQRSIGPGIFEFRDALASQKKSEAPLPHPFGKSCLSCLSFAPIDVSDFTANTTTQGVKHDLPLRVAQASEEVSKGPWSIFCNACEKPIPNIHYHCSICDFGDFDLCESCVSSGKVCPGASHWLIKRTIQNGRYISSTTERVVSKPKQVASPVSSPVPSPKPETIKEIPGAFTEDVKTGSDQIRTCNACVISRSSPDNYVLIVSANRDTALPDRDFITCMQCEDYDLCLSCHSANKHGHHPGHHFKPAVEGTELSLSEEALLPAGRNVRHNALCDGCDKSIHGVRHKCFDCPDFDYCNECYKNARHTHPRHRFAAIYDQIKGRPVSSVSHHGIYCDGPLCNGKPHQSYIQGVRYKCVVCHDTDFCQACEALPTSFHNKTHPLVKFKTPVNNLTISTESETKHGIRKLGDREASRSVHSPAAPASHRQPTNATAPVKTVADIKPSPRIEDEKIEEKKTEAPMPVSEPAVATPMLKTPSHLLQAHFVSDCIADGTAMAPSTRFTQAWTLRNPGPHAWPAGCSVRFVGGDNMLNVDNAHAAAVSDIADATESNVVGREVLPGEAASFAVTMKAPVRAGKFISYWRLKSADGTPFGHRLWCDINVKEKIVEEARSPIIVHSSPQTQSFFSLYKDRMNALKTHLDQVVDSENQKVPTLPAAVVASHVLAQVEKPTEAVQDPQNEIKVEVQTQAKVETAELEARAEAEQDESELKGSQMVFPTLEKESPSSSTYQSFSGSGTMKNAQEEAEGASQTSHVTSVISDDEDEAFEDISDDLEVLSANDEEETEDDGFLTDDDYDILDASDQETVASMK